MALELVEVSEILDDMQRRFWRDINSGTRTFRDRVMKRRNLVHNLETEWQLTGPLAKLPQFKSDAARKRWFELRSRICENHFVVRSEPLRNAPTLRTASNDFESVMNTGIALVEESNGYILQEALADGQIVDGLGILHWRKADEIYPAFPEAVEMDTAPSMEERDRYRRRSTDSGSYRWIESAENDDDSNSNGNG